MGRLNGKVALVTGAARGQGATEARLFATEGASVLLGDVRDDEGAQVADSIICAGGVAAFVHLDVADELSWRSAIAEADRRFGRLDILVNNAGINIRRTIEEMTIDELDVIVAVNLKGVFIGTKAAAPLLRRTGRASIVNVASTGGIIGVPLSAAYTATKGGVRALTKSTAVQYAREGIRCNAVDPGPVATDFLRELLDDPDRLSRREQEIPLGRLGTALDVAFAVLYLASDEAGFVTGTELVVDGGLTAA